MTTPHKASESLARIINDGEVELVPTGALETHPRNPREGDLGAIIESIRAHGFYGTLTVQRSTGFICAGNHRFLAAIELGFKVLPVTYVDVDDEEALRILVADNRSSDLAYTNPGSVYPILQQLHETARALKGLGYSSDELADMAAELNAQPFPTTDLEDVTQAEKIHELWKVEPGQVWEARSAHTERPHRVVCGNSLDKVVIDAATAHVEPHVIYTDPPWGIEVVNKKTRSTTGEAKIGKGSIGRDKPFGSKKQRGLVGYTSRVAKAGTYFPVIGDDSTDTAKEAVRLYLGLYPNATHVWWGAENYADALPPKRGWLVWDKETAGDFADAELAWTNRDKPVRLLRHKWAGMLRASEKSGPRSHPTQKPVVLAEWVLNLIAKPGQIVLDPFAGAGAAVLAAERLGMTGRAIELVPEYASVILERLKNLGLEPKLVDKLDT